MSNPYVGEIRLFAGNFAPSGWLFCEGQLLSIADNETLFQLIGTTYGGDGQNTFALPDLRGRVPIHQAGVYVMGELAGVESVQLSGAQVPVPAHTHVLNAASGKADSRTPTNGVMAVSASGQMFSTGAPSVSMAAAAVGPGNSTGGATATPHSNMQPYLCLSFIISLFGIFPSPA